MLSLNRKIGAIREENVALKMKKIYIYILSLPARETSLKEQNNALKKR